MTTQPEQFLTASLRQSSRGDDICHILAAAINSVDAAEAVREHVQLTGNQLIIDQKSYDLGQYQHVHVLGVGKAAIPMTAMLVELLGNHLSGGLVITKQGYLEQGYRLNHPRLAVFEASHPVPGQSNLAASAYLGQHLLSVKKDDLVICLLSGGGSALLMKPSRGITLEDIQATTQLLLSCGADIGEINTIRKHLDEFKGGKLAKLIYPARVVTLILSDVMGDPLDQIASGPTVADPTTFYDAWSILIKYQLEDRIPVSILSHLQAGIEGIVPETLKAGDPAVKQVQHMVIGNNALAIFTAEQAAQKFGFSTRVLDDQLHGEASSLGETLVEKAKAQFSSMAKPACLLAGGETTVQIRGHGKGGRNQELALGAVKNLSGDRPMLLVSLATDGDDGPTDAAGAVATDQTYQIGRSLGLNPEEYLANNDSYHYFERLGDLIKTGPTLTNVNDLVLIFTW